ncbi:MAG: hypothetical protein V4576_00140 [Patescibacteria group bacterium]
MLYLIHDEQRKKIIADYYARIVQVVTWFLVGIFIIVGILSLPTILLLQTEGRTSTDKIQQLEKDIEAAKSTSTEEQAAIITNKIDILRQTYPVSVQATYIDLERIAESISGVHINSINVDALTKNVQIVMEVRDKEVAKAVVDAFNKSKYKGATLPYSVLSEKATFTFAQNLKYE